MFYRDIHIKTNVTIGEDASLSEVLGAIRILLLETLSVCPSVDLARFYPI